MLTNKKIRNLLLFGLSVTVILVIRSQFYSKDSIRKENVKTLHTLDRLLSEKTIADVCTAQGLKHTDETTSKEEKSYKTTVDFLKMVRGDNPLKKLTTGDTAMDQMEVVKTLYIWLAIWGVSLICDIVCFTTYCVRCFCGACCKCCNR